MADQKKIRKASMFFSTLIALALIAVGVVFICYRQKALNVTSVIIGCAILLYSIVSLVNVGKIKLTQFKGAAIGKSAVSLVTSIVLIVAPIVLKERSLNFAIYILAFMLIILGICSFAEMIIYDTAKMRISFFLEGVLSILTAVLFMKRPERIAAGALMIIGAVFVVIGILVFIIAFSRRYDLEEVKEV